MKLLLTSNGLCNKTIANRFIEMIGKPINEAIIVFIPTAANVNISNKTWFVDDLVNIKKLKPKMLDIVDISALPKEIWQPRLEAADVLFFSGGNTFHLIYHIKKSGLDKLLPKLLETRLYTGISAGSIATSKSLALSSERNRTFVKKHNEYIDESGLSLVDFHIRPHFNSPIFPNLRDERLKELAKNVSEPVYAIDDETAISIIDNKIDIVSEGEWKKYN
ncbi:Type 1 glutamine amidotransferase-like domain-containing protein [bacterium]|nr:Type 1 glutamine amidotransferase-like domain-containing protein [bacterium]